MSLLLFLSRLNIFPASWTSSFASETSHKSHIIQLAHLPSSLVPSTTNDKRLIVVGDVHGCFKPLERLLEEVNYSKRNDHLILVGDLINKGPDSHGVIKLARELGASCVRGNHEDKVLTLRREQDLDNVTFDGTMSRKMLDANMLAAGLSKADLAWLKQCPLILELGPIPSLPHAATVVVVHAGLVPGIPLLDQDPFAVMHMRSISKQSRGFVPREDKDDGEPWYKVWNHEQNLLKEKKKGEDATMMVLYGHDSKRGLNQREWSLGLDSGCVGGGRLSAVVIDGKHAKVKSIKCKE